MGAKFQDFMSQNPVEMRPGRTCHDQRLPCAHALVPLRAAISAELNPNP